MTTNHKGFPPSSIICVFGKAFLELPGAMCLGFIMHAFSFCWTPAEPNIKHWAKEPGYSSVAKESPTLKKHKEFGEKTRRTSLRGGLRFKNWIHHLSVMFSRVWALTVYQALCWALPACRRDVDGGMPMGEVSYRKVQWASPRHAVVVRQLLRGTFHGQAACPLTKHQFKHR